jgi:hypothetical protein
VFFDLDDPTPEVGTEHLEQNYGSTSVDEHDLESVQSHADLTRGDVAEASYSHVLNGEGKTEAQLFPVMCRAGHIRSVIVPTEASIIVPADYNDSIQNNEVFSNSR